jgi:hypothetical protein
MWRRRFFGRRVNIVDQIVQENKLSPSFISSDFQAESSGLDPAIKMRVAETEDCRRLFQLQNLAGSEIRPESGRTGKSGRR